MTLTEPPKLPDYAPLLEGLSREELLDLAATVDALGPDEVPESHFSGPQTKEEFAKHFKEHYGVIIPAVAVCPGHVAPLDAAWEVYTWSVLRVLWIVSRGGAKTSLMAWLHDCQANHWPGYASFNVGSTQKQGDRMYEYMLPFLVEGGVRNGKPLPHIQRSVQLETVWKIGSKVEVSPSTVDAVNGPRVPRLVRDEIELMDEPVRKQSGNIPAARKTKDGRLMPAQIVDMSTMKWAGGYVHETKLAYDEAIRKGNEPEKQVRIWCLYEVAEENPACRGADPDERAARLTELGRDPCELCNCDKLVKGDMGDRARTPRTLEKVCKGRLFRSRGFKPMSDVELLFAENDRRTWNAEQECSEPSGEGVYIESFDRVTHGITGWVPDPELGLIYQGVDFGGTDQHSVGWYQRLDRPVFAKPYIGEKPILLPAGALVRFAEVWQGGIGNVQLGQLVIAKENRWREMFPGWKVKERYPDTAAAAGILDWKHHLKLKMVSRIRKDFENEVRYINDWVEGDNGIPNFYIDIDACPMGTKSIEAWKAENNHEVHDWASHTGAEMRYLIHNLTVLDRKRRPGESAGGSAPGAADDGGPNRPQGRGPRSGGGGSASAAPSPNRAQSRSIRRVPAWRRQIGSYRG